MKFFSFLIININTSKAFRSDKITFCGSLYEFRVMSHDKRKIIYQTTKAIDIF